MPTIRIDDDVWNWLKQQARPLEDTPNSILRRVAGLQDDDSPVSVAIVEGSSRANARPGPTHNFATRHRRAPHRVYSGLTGRQLNVEWKVNAKHALYHKLGKFYNHLQYFPGALFDPNGYVVFKTEEQFNASSHIRRGKQVDVPKGIASIPGYVRVRKAV